MPSKTQIIPEHDYAHVMIVEHDNSQRPNDKAAAVLQTYCDMMFVFASPKGIDMKLQTISTGLTGFDEGYGFGSFDDYGQPYLNARNAASSNAATLHCLRVTADDATYAGGALVAHYRVSGLPTPEEPVVPIPSEVVLVPDHAGVIASDDPTEDPKNVTIRVAGTDIVAEISVDNEAVFGSNLKGNYIDLVLDLSKLLEIDPAKTYQVTQINPALAEYDGVDEFIFNDNGTWTKKRTYTGESLLEGYAFLVGADSTIGIAVQEWGVDPDAVVAAQAENDPITNNTDLGVLVSDKDAALTVEKVLGAEDPTYQITTSGECVSGTLMNPELFGDTSGFGKFTEMQVIFPVETGKFYRVEQYNPMLSHYSGDPAVKQQGNNWVKTKDYAAADISDGYSFLIGGEPVRLELYEADKVISSGDVGEVEVNPFPIAVVEITDGFTYVAERTPEPVPEPEPGPIGDVYTVTVVSTLAFVGAGTSETLRARAGVNRINRQARAMALADEEETPPTHTDPKMEIYYTFEPLARQMTDEDDLGSLADVEEVVDADGFKAVKVFELSARGRGAFGNNLRFVIKSYARGDKLAAYKNYNFVLYEIDKATMVQKEQFTVSFLPDAVNNSGETLYLDYLVGDPYQNSKYFRCWTNPAAFKEMYEAYQTINPDPSITVNTFDPLTGTVFGSSLSKLPGIEIVNSERNMVSLTGASGIALMGGDDGAFTKGRPGREEAMQKAYLKAWSGEIDEMIYSRKMYPTDIILDACFPPETKNAISNLTHTRKDAMTFYDLGITFNTFEGLLEELADIEPFVSTRDEAIEAYYGKVQDPATWKIIKVSSTYPLAYLYPAHFQSHGAKHVPLAGSSYGIMTSFINGSAYPVFDDDLHSKEMDKLAEVHVNYLKLNTLKQIVRGAQDTRQDADTNLSECSNVFVLHDIRRDAVKLCEQYEYNFAESSDMQRFNKAAAILAEKYAAAQVSSISATFEMTEWEAERGILHLYIEFVHKRIIKRAIVEIDINRGSVVV